MKLKEVQLVTINDENYILSEDSNNQLFVFCINDNLVVANFDELLGEQIQWAKPVLIEPKNIGWVNEGADENGLFRLTLLNKHHLETIKSNDGVCRIEIDDINTELIEDFDPLTNVAFVPLFHQSKVLIHL